MAGAPRGWDGKAQALWLRGDKHGAIQRALVPLNAAGQRPPKALLAQLAYYLFLMPDYPAAVQVLDRAHGLYPDDLEILLNLATARSRARDHPGAVATAEKYLSLGGGDANVFDMLANSQYRLGRLDEAKAAGEKALAIKDKAATAPPGVALLPASGGARQRRKIIGFSLWGANPRYLRGALHNAIAVRSVFPGWTCRFYVDSIDGGVHDALAELGAELVDCKAAGGAERLSRRFLVADDPQVGHFLVRDCDSVVTEREADAVDEWLASDKSFHVMRDWWTHTDPILAGLWGGIAGVLPPLGPLLAAYRPKHLETPNWDQWFLRDRVWPLVRDAALIHDRYFKSRNATPFPGPVPSGNTHVGQDEFAVRRALQRAFLAAWIDRLPALRLPDGS